MVIATKFAVVALSCLLTFTSVAAEKSKCDVCRDLTKHFKKHFDETSGQNYGGGNTAWEEKSLGSYATSETRLVEILEKTAKDCDYKCGSLLEDQEEFLENWFFKKQESHPDLHQTLCIDSLVRCCPDNTFGKECKECAGGLDAPCSGHGSCKGSGDREGTGECECNMGYNGTTCDTCSKNYINNTDTNTCEACNSLCEGQCTGVGPTGCTACIKGYELHETEGCKDINECSQEGLGCGDPLEECVNSPGSFECVCKSGYHRVNGKCQLEDLYADENESDDDMETADEKADTDGGDQQIADTQEDKHDSEDNSGSGQESSNLNEDDSAIKDGSSSISKEENEKTNSDKKENEHPIRDIEDAFNAVREKYSDVTKQNIENFKDRLDLHDYDVEVKEEL